MHTSRGIERTDDTHTSRGIERDEDRYTSRGIERDEVRYTSREIERTEDRYTSRGIERDEDRYTSRGMDRTEDRYTSRGMERARVIVSHLSRTGADADVNPDPHQVSMNTAGSSDDVDIQDDDVVICAAVRTPICKAKKGGLKDCLPDDLLSAVFTGLINHSAIEPTLIDDICVGNVLQPGAGAKVSRIAQFLSEIPETVPLHATNRICSSGLQACANIAAAIKAGYIDVGIAAGVESMSSNEMIFGEKPGLVINPRLERHDLARSVITPVGQTAEKLAERFHITRKMQDEFSAKSHAKAAKAKAEGRFKNEIIPVSLYSKNEQCVVKITEDDCIRSNCTVDQLSKLKQGFTKGGTVTAGNSGPVSDGAAGVLFARRSAARRYNLPVLGVFKAYTTVGVLPELNGTGPTLAIPKVLLKAGLQKEDIDIYEINETFACQAKYCLDTLGVPEEKLNPNGGSIALGHPLGCAGARQMTTLIHELQRRGKKGSYGIVSVSVGIGMGAAAIIQYTG